MPPQCYVQAAIWIPAIIMDDSAVPSSLFLQVASGNDGTLGKKIAKGLLAV